MIGVAGSGEGHRRSAWWPQGRWSFLFGMGLGLALAAVLALLVHLLITGGGADSTSDGLEPGELVIVSGADVSEGGQRQALLDVWNNAHPQNQARIVEAPPNADGQHADMVRRARDKSPDVDIYNIDVTWTAEFAENGYIRSLDEAGLRKDRFLDGFLAEPKLTCMYKGRLWALPFNTDAALLFYRTDLVTQSPDPTAPAGTPLFTWDQIVQEIISAIADKEPNSPLAAGYAGQLNDYEGLTVNALEAIWAVGGDVVDDKENVVVDAKTWQTGLGRLVDGIPPGDEADATNAFKAGKVVFMRNWPVAYRDLLDTDAHGAGSSPVKFDVTTLPPPPGGTAAGHSVLGGQNLAIASQTAQPRAAQALIRFLTETASQRQLFDSGGFAATRTAVYDDPAIKKRYPYVTTLRAAIQQARLRPVTPYYTRFSEVFRHLARASIDKKGRSIAEIQDQLDRALHGR